MRPSPREPDWRAAALKCVVPMEALHADNLAGSQLIAPSLRVYIADAVVALREAVSLEGEVRGESLQSDAKIAPHLPDTFVERAIQVARANPGEPDVFVMLTVFEAAYIREKYVERNRLRVSGNAVGGVGGKEP